jgi:tetratricopeptide (TPR) repeat protein
MKAQRGVKILVGALVVTSLVLAACATANRAAVKGASADSGRALAAGDFEKAIEIQKQLYRNDPRDKKILSGYVRTVEECKKAADLALRRGSYGTASGTYRILLGGWDGFSAFAAKLTFRRADLEAGLKSCLIAQWGVQYGQELKAGRYDKALAVYQAGLGEYPGDKTLGAVYAGTVEELEAIGRKALDANDYALAGRVDALLLRNFASFDALATRPRVSREELAEAIELCRSSLTKNGLAEYRKGNLEKAIATWQGLLVFDPENAEIRKAVETAKAQLAKLKSMAPGEGRWPSCELIRGHNTNFRIS